VLPEAVPSVAEKLAEAEHLVDSTVVTVQRIALELRPSALDALGLPAAVRDEARRFERRTSIVTRFAISDSVQPPADVATAFFRILQELLTNVARHADASSVDLVLEERDDVWVLTVSDDGVGFHGDDHQRLLSVGATASGERRVRSLGLLGVIERAESHGGHVVVSGSQGHGTTVTVRVPRTRVGGDDATRPDR
jgi:two-component system sensor histidine kinase UhpB